MWPASAAPFVKTLSSPTAQLLRNVRPNHEKVARANPRNLSFTTGPVQRHKLSYQIIIANHQTAALASKLYILRFAAENRVLKDPVALSHRGVSFDYRMRANLGSSANDDFVLNDRVRSNARTSPNPRFGTHNRGRVN